MLSLLCAIQLVVSISYAGLKEDMMGVYSVSHLIRVLFAFGKNVPQTGLH